MTLSTGQLAQLEERNAELELQYSTVVQQNLELQQAERELRDNLLTFVSRKELQDVQEKLRKSEQDRVRVSKIVWLTDTKLLNHATWTNSLILPITRQEEISYLTTNFFFRLNWNWKKTGCKRWAT